MAAQVEGNRLTTSALVRAVVERRYLTVRYLTGLWASREVTMWDGERLPDGPVTFVGFERPEGLHEESRVFTPENLHDIVRRDGRRLTGRRPFFARGRMAG
ncbi:hypothetical protein [Actinomadura sp. NTSP31]|uniref:hypothetical protein n=1 Tax=Actinomadura sp. NTSP31 TaxID=1735447 RepID=UPI0035C01068